MLFATRVRGTRELRNYITRPSPIESLLPLIPTDSRVVVGDYDASSFIRHKQVTRIYHANKKEIEFDYLVINKKTPENLADYL